MSLQKQIRMKKERKTFIDMGIIEDKHKEKKCYICGTGEELTEHHKFPLSIGGSDVPENKCLLCLKHQKQFHKGISTKLTPEKYLERLERLKKLYKMERLKK